MTATAELAGPASSIQLEPGQLDISMPIKLHLSNPLIGSSCYIGSNSNPVRVNLITGTTTPPPPNRAFSGHIGEFSFVPPNIAVLRGNLDVDNAFAIPGASGCGLLGILNPLINLKLGLPSSAGHNALSIANDVAIEPHFQPGLDRIHDRASVPGTCPGRGRRWCATTAPTRASSHPRA